MRDTENSREMLRFEQNLVSGSQGLTFVDILKTRWGDEQLIKANALVPKQDKVTQEIFTAIKEENAKRNRETS